MQIVEDMLRLPDSSHKFDVGATVHECNDNELGYLNVEFHTLDSDPLAKPEQDHGRATTLCTPQLLPFPMYEADI